MKLPWSFKDILLASLPIVSGLSSAYLLTSQKSVCSPSKVQPPAVVFAVVWPVLYILMGISLVLYKKSVGQFRSIPVIAFVLFTTLMQAWWIIFSRLCTLIIAPVSLAIIAFLFAMLAISFYKRSKLAGILLVPLVIWLSFATFLSSQSTK